MLVFKRTDMVSRVYAGFSFKEGVYNLLDVGRDAAAPARKSRQRGGGGGGGASTPTHFFFLIKVVSIFHIRDKEYPPIQDRPL